MKGNWHFLPSFVAHAATAGLGASRLGMTEMGAGAGVGAVEGALEPLLNPSHFSLQSLQAFGVPKHTPLSKQRPSGHLDPPIESFS